MMSNNTDDGSVQVILNSYEVMITAVDSTTSLPITSSFFRAFAENGNWHGTDDLPMYDPAGKAITYTLSANPNDPKTAVWLIKAQNSKKDKGPIFYAQYSLDLLKEQKIVFVVVPKSP